MDGKRIRNDIILLLCLLVTAGAVWCALTLLKAPGEYVLVIVDGRETARYRLDSELTTDIETEGGHINTLVITGGKAEITSADCPDKLCVNQKPISRAGESIICLPHKLVIRIEGAGEVDAP